jgi:hypothetical protein
MLAGDLLQRLPECIFKAYAGLRPAIEAECLPTIDLVTTTFSAAHRHHLSGRTLVALSRGGACLASQA